MKSGY